MSRQKQQEANAEAVFNGATFESMSGGPTKIVLAGMFHADPSLIEAEQTEAEWTAAIEQFLAETA
jgi:hypothetical protein